MLDDDLDSQSTPATMFPFLSVLFCTIGALVVIMVIGSMLTTVRGESIDVKLEDVRVRAQKLADLQKYVVAMETSISEITAANSAWSTLSGEAESMSSDYEEELSLIHI